MKPAAYYPRDGTARRRTLVGDAIVAGLLVVFAVFAFAIHDAVGDLGQMGRDIREAGEGLTTSGRDTAGEIRSVFDALGPLGSVGDGLADALEKQTVATGEDLAASGRQGERDAARIATLAAWVTFLIPASLLLAVTLPPRLRQVRRLRET